MRYGIVLTVFFCALVCAAPASASGITQKMQQTYESIDSFTADFSQTLVNAASREEEKRAGTIAYKKPVLIRWETFTPEKELLIVAGDAVWDVFPDDEEVFKYPVEEIVNSKTMIRFLSGEADVEEDFRITQEQDEDGAVRLTLIPREPEPGLVEAVIWVDKKTSLLTRIRIRDFYANSNDLILRNIKTNPMLADSLFEYTPEPGVTVFDNTEEQGRDLQ